MRSCAQKGVRRLSLETQAREQKERSIPQSARTRLLCSAFFRRSIKKGIARIRGASLQSLSRLRSA